MIRLTLLTLCGSLICRYDTTALRNGAGDAGAVRPIAPMDRAEVFDTGVVPDVFDAGAAIDSGPTRPPRQGSCGQPHLDINSQRSAQMIPEGAPYLTSVLDTTSGVEGVTIPGTVPPNCGAQDFRQPGASPTLRILRYEVQRGPRVTLSTNTGACGSSDLRVMAWTSCDTLMARSMPLGCSDDDGFRLCGSCASGTRDGVCSAEQSSLTLGNLVPGDILWFAVHTLQISALFPANGPFRAWIGENALTPTALPVDAPRVAHRCTCQLTTPREVRTVRWPESADYGASMPQSFVLAQDQTGVLGAREVPGLASVLGVSARFTIASVVRDPDPACFEDPSAILDLVVGNQAEGWVVASAVLNANSVRAPLTVSFPYTPVSRAAGSAMGIPPTGTGNQYNFELRLRRSLPDRRCVRLSLDLTASAQNNVILYGE